MSSNDWIDIAVSSIPILHDQKIDMAEAKQLIYTAEQDGVVDKKEKEVLANIFSKVDLSKMSSDVLKKIQDFKVKHQF